MFIDKGALAAWERDQEELKALLQPLTYAGWSGDILLEPRVKLRCGKCRRVLTIAVIHRDPWGIDWHEGANTLLDNGQHVAQADPRPGFPGLVVHRPHVGVRWASPDEYFHTRNTLVCSPRCGATYTFTQLRAARAFARAVKNGNSTLVAGVDL